MVHDTMLISSGCVLRWRLVIEKYSPNLLYILGAENIVANTLNRLLRTNLPEDQEKK